MQMTPFSGLIKASLFLCAFDLAITSFLLQRHQQLLSTNTRTSVAYLKNRNTNYGFQPIAVVHSLPQALFVWALLLFSMQGFWMARHADRDMFGYMVGCSPAPGTYRRRHVTDRYSSLGCWSRAE
ncbi:hypothetical protein EDB89DRAFT_1030020 [Lactarius sanguifluus]|nr:hypothetical protein EDB89DRAFT_1030020 [Lactarius sanguifluus]